MWAVAVVAVCTVSVPVATAQTTVLIMGETGHPLSTPPDTLPYVRQYLAAAVDGYVLPSASLLSAIPSGPYNAVAVITPAQSAPTYGTMPIGQSLAEGLLALHICITSSTCVHNKDVGSLGTSPTDTFVVFGYSQSAAIAMQEKLRLASTYGSGDGPDVTFVVVGTSRPNGGFAVRDTTGLVTQLFFGVPVGEQDHDAPPTNTQYVTVDVAAQYDGLADAPLNPLNLLAALNAYVGFARHVAYAKYSLNDANTIDQGQYGDTHYYLIPAPILPLLMPLESFGLLGHALADTLDAPLRVIIESAYDRTVSPGVPTPWDHSYFPDPIGFATNLAISIPAGLDNGIEDLVGVRPFLTTRPGPYGVGGPAVTYPTPDTSQPPISAVVTDTTAGEDMGGAETVIDAAEPTPVESTAHHKADQAQRFSPPREGPSATVNRRPLSRPPSTGPSRRLCCGAETGKLSRKGYRLAGDLPPPRGELPQPGDLQADRLSQPGGTEHEGDVTDRRPEPEPPEAPAENLP